MTTPLFEIDTLTYDVPGRRLLDGLSLTLPAGRLIGLIGHNGSGKSTLLKLLARQVTGGGRILFEGRDLAGWPARDHARRLAYMPQHTPPTEGMLVEELVALGRYPWHGALGRPGPADRAAIDAALAACGLDPWRGRQVDTLSGGEAQRAWLAMLVAQEAGCLLLDEPISALDIAHQVEVLDLVRRLSHENGRSVIVVLHDLNMAARYCDHIVALSAGRLALQGPPGEILTPAALRGIYGVEMEMLTRADGSPVAHPL
ncbi:ABC transporter ATP-binding protein [Marinibacterium sp. SX1]|uniref:ABC transporter ATP-binding protein n=1 Tax=Marinibacterium sp. SX1 TaxID=3388424 RepID=UPI003D170CD6